MYFKGAAGAQDVTKMPEDREKAEFVQHLVKASNLNLDIRVVTDPKTSYCAYATTVAGQHYIAVNPSCVGAPVEAGRYSPIAVGVLADSTGWIRMRTAVGVTFVLAGMQLLMLAYPVLLPNRQPVDPGFYNGGLPWRIMVRFEQWDWAPVHEIAQDCGLSRPKIAFLGMGRPLNPAQIEYPWFLAGESPSEKNGYTEPLWLWRYEEGPFDWTPVMAGADGDSFLIQRLSYFFRWNIIENEGQYTSFFFCCADQPQARNA